MDPIAFFTALAPTVVAAVVAGVVSYLAGRSMKSFEWRLALTRDRLAARERLYGEFLAEATTLQLQSIDAKVERAADFSSITAKMELISLQAPDAVVAAAREVWTAALDANAAKPKEGPGTGFFALKQTFIKEVRSEVEALQR